MPSTIRTFIGVPVAPPPALRRLCERVASFGRNVKAVDVDSMHITLKFLGDTPRDQVDEIAQLISASSAKMSTMSTSVHGLDAFPTRARPSILWATLARTDELKRLAADLEAKLAPLGFPAEDREYRPHLTIARVRAARKASRATIPEVILELLEEHATTDFGEVRFEEAVLYHSTLSDAGPTYHRLSSARFSG